jgi:hypothetical protein
MRIDFRIADTVVGWIGFITLGRALHADADASFHSRLRHTFTSVGHRSIWTASTSLPRNPRRTVIKIVQGTNL